LCFGVIRYTARYKAPIAVTPIFPTIMTPRLLKVAAAQVGAVNRHDAKSNTVRRMTGLLEEAASQKVQLVVFPETAFTTFFPRFLFENPAELEKYFEQGDDITHSQELKPLFDSAKSHHIDLYVGYAERTDDGRGFNTCIYYSGQRGGILSKYRKVHLPGTKEPFADPTAINQLEKRYFLPGDLGFKAFRAPGLVLDAVKKGMQPADANTLGKGDPIMGMMICNDRRWPEAWRMYGMCSIFLQRRHS
jgi:predicted amidohydrolase